MSPELHSSSEQAITQADITTLAQQYVLTLFNQKNDSRIVFHTYKQTIEIAKMVNSLATAEGYTMGEWETAELASWFVNAGYLFDYQNPAPKSVELAEKFFAAHHIPKEKKTVIIDALKCVLSELPPKTHGAQLLSDAVGAVHFGERFFENLPFLRLELELVLNQHFTREEWELYQEQRLLNARFYTSHSKVVYEPLIANHLLELRERQEKRKNKTVEIPEEPGRKFKHLDRKTASGTQTFFRTTYRNHINLSAIADNKANIMISVNAILISVIISVISYRNMTESLPTVWMPAIIFLFAGLASLIFAVLAARPKVTSLITPETPIEEAKQNIVFFGNFVQLNQEKYEELMDEMFRDSELLYGNMTRDLYNLGKVLDKKYRYLSISYSIFMVGFIMTVLGFFYALFGF